MTRYLQAYFHISNTMSDTIAHDCFIKKTLIILEYKLWFIQITTKNVKQTSKDNMS